MAIRRWEISRTQTILLSTTEAEPRLLTALPAGASLWNWSPGGRRIAHGTRFGRGGMLNVVRNLKPPERQQLIVLEPDSGARYVWPLSFDSGLIIWNPRGPLHEPTFGQQMSLAALAPPF